MKSDLKQDVTTVTIVGFASNVNLVYRMTPDITIWYKNEAQDDGETPTTKDAQIVIINDYIKYIINAKIMFPDVFSQPTPEYTILITKVKGNMAWSHEYKIDPLKLLQKFGDIEDLIIKFKDHESNS